MIDMTRSFTLSAAVSGFEVFNPVGIATSVHEAIACVDEWCDMYEEHFGDRVVLTSIEIDHKGHDMLLQASIVSTGEQVITVYGAAMDVDDQHDSDDSAVMPAEVVDYVTNLLSCISVSSKYC